MSVDRGLHKSEFRDPVHGFVTVYDHETRIIDTQEFQRLRRIHQLALQSYVYHGAEHSRFGHSLGVMHLAGEITRRIWEKKSTLLLECAGLGPEDATDYGSSLFFAARLSGLLHDIGHAPFSHSGESALFGKLVGVSGGLEQLGHEDYVEAIVRNSDIGAIVDESKRQTSVGVEDVVAILGKHGMYDTPFVQEVISSPWDADKMDYLLRDARYCGVEYGIFDLSRLVDTLTLDDQYQSPVPQLAIQFDGFHNIEALILARYFMFNQVYFHNVRRAFDIVLTEFIGDLLQEEYGYRQYPGPRNVAQYMSWDDTRVLARAVEKADSSEKNLAWRIVARRHPKTVFETVPHPSPMELKRIQKLSAKLREKFDGIYFWLDRAIDHPEKFKKEDLLITYNDNRRPPSSLVTISKALGGLEEIAQCRLYADLESEDSVCGDVINYCHEYMSGASGDD